MIQLVRHFRFLFVSVVMAACTAGTPLLAQPSPSNQNANAVNEQMLLRRLGKVQGRVELPGKRERVPIQPAGREWLFFKRLCSTSSASPRSSA
jgi:hypothetical protein